MTTINTFPSKLANDWVKDLTFVGLLMRANYSDLIGILFLAGKPE